MELLGLSVDGLYAHIAGERNLERKARRPHRVSVHRRPQHDGGEGARDDHADSERRVGGAGDVHHRRPENPPGAPLLSDGSRTEYERNPPPRRCASDALQTNTKHRGALPANWRPGDRVIVPTPKTVAEARPRLEDRSLEVFDRYLAKKTL
ncbi:MAG: hypothetical protein IMX05_08665 [Hydrogenibacillus schlegelii]|nr:hypothetical protein [Hydrogenibacillus schlegelii]